MLNYQNTVNTNPANNDSLPGCFKFGFEEMMKRLNTCMPAKVISYDRAANRAQVSVQINTVSVLDEETAGVTVSNVPVLLLGGGGFMINFPLNAGDLGWIIATDRDISLFLQSYQAQQPGVFILRNFASSLFIPDVMTNFTIAGGDASNAVIQSTDSSIKISLSNTGVEITAPTITLNGDVIINGETTMSDNVNLNYIVPQGGNLYVQGSIQAESSITPDIPPP